MSVPSLPYFGIQNSSASLIESIKISNKIEKKELKGSGGDVAKVQPYNPTTEFTVKGHGATTVVPGTGSSGLTSVTGGVTLIEMFDLEEGNEAWASWSYNGINYPNAA